MTNKTILTKQLAAEIIFRTQLDGSQEIVDKCISKMVNLHDITFIKRFRKSTDLQLCSFAPNLFYIRY